MITKDVKAMITYSFSYADEIGWKKNGSYPKDAKISLRNQLKNDLLVFLGFLYDDESSDLMSQVSFIRNVLEIDITAEAFMEMRNSLKPEAVLGNIPPSLKYFVSDDLSPYSRRLGYGMSLSKYLVNTFNDVGCYFIAFYGISDFEADRLSQFIAMMNNYLDSFGLLKHNPDEIREAQGIVDLDDERRVQQSIERNAMQSLKYSSGSGTGSFMSNLLLGSRFGVRGFNEYQSRRNAESSRPYTTSRAELDAQRMMVNYNNKYEGTGLGFDSGMLLRTPTGSVDRSMNIDDGGGKVAAPAPEKPESSDPFAGNGKSDEESLALLMYELDSLIGLRTVKENLNGLINLVKVRKMRNEMGLKTPDMSLHLVFSGNPGTGKTTVARLLAKIYHQLGVVSKGQLVEVDRAGLVEGYVGQTAQKTAQVCDEAMGGVLFIDEAYTLTNADGQDFGQEAVDTLLKRMEDDRGDFIVIVAGYTDEMQDFIESNPGLKSRFNKFIEFPDYSGDELFEIYNLMGSSQDYVLSGEASDYVKAHLAELADSQSENFANAREVRNYFERCVERQATRIVSGEVIDANSLTTLKLEDVRE